MAGSSLANVTLGTVTPTMPAPAAIPACPTIKFTFARSDSSQSSIIASETPASVSFT